MCDTAEDMDEYIEYEFARDCIEIADDEDDDDEGVEFVQQNPESLLDVAAEHLSTENNFLYEDENDEDYEILEELDEDVDQMLLQDPALDIKAEILETEEEDESKQVFKDEFMEEEEAQEQHLIDDDELTNGFEQEHQHHQQQQEHLEQLLEEEEPSETSQVHLKEETDDVEEIEYEEVRLEDTEETEDEVEQMVVPDKNILAKVEKPKKPEPQPCPEDKGPKGVARKYMLYDELVATVVDYDNDGTPIVEFSVSNNDADEKLPMECGICPDVMSRTKIPAHLRTHLVPGTNRYQCIYCEETYKDCKYLAGHARRHMGIRPYVCEICKLYFSTKQDLRVHNQRRHQEKDHICEVCGKTFAQNTQLKRHREATHEKKRRFKCDLCPKSYYKNFSLQEHIRAVHMGKRRIIVCPFCGMQCRDAHKMARHRKLYHLHQTHFECHICNEEFTDIKYFDAHKRSIQCRNNTRRKMEEEGLQQQQQQQEEDQQQLQQTTLNINQNKQEILIQDDDEEEDENTQQYSQNLNEQHLLQTQNFHPEQNHQQQQQFQHLQQHQDVDDDNLETVQIIDECDYKHLIGSTHHHHHNNEQFMLNNDLLQQHKIEQITGDDVGEEGELVYEITIDSNE